MKPILIITKEDQLLHHGRPETFRGHVLVKYLRQGCKVDLITEAEFEERKKEYKEKISND